jgi:hypothetical protein
MEVAATGVTVNFAPRKPLLMAAPGCRVEHAQVSKVWVEDYNAKRLDYRAPTWKITNTGTEWTADEDRMVLSAGYGELEAVAAKLGRTYRACYMRRYVVSQTMSTSKVRENFLSRVA